MVNVCRVFSVPTPALCSVAGNAVFTSIKIIYYDNIPHYTLFLSVTVVSVCQLWLFYGKFTINIFNLISLSDFTIVTAALLLGFSSFSLVPGQNFTV